MNFGAIFRPATREDSYRIAELFAIASGGRGRVRVVHTGPQYPGLTQCRKAKRLCDPCGAFQAGHLAPTAR